MKRIMLYFAAAAVTVSCADSSRLAMVVGTYTDSGSEGLYSFSFDQKSGEATLLDSCHAINPSYLTFSADNSRIYSVCELEENNAAVCALGFDVRDGSFTYMDAALTEDANPCYVATNGKIVLTANYGGSLSVFPLSSNGSVKPLSARFNGSTGGPDPERQQTPHVHCAVFSNDGKHVYASDFSADRILCFDVVKRGRRLKPSTAADGQQLVARVSPDYGPRHIIFDRKGRHAYVIGELSGAITVFDVDRHGVLTAKQTIDADPFDGRGSADIHLSPDGRYLYASNRLKGDGIAIFSVDASTGELAEAGYQPTGLHPRHFNITPNGRYLLCACRDDDAIWIYARDPKSGLLTDTGRRIGVRKPVCVQFAE